MPNIEVASIARSLDKLAQKITGEEADENYIEVPSIKRSIDKIAESDFFNPSEEEEETTPAAASGLFVHITTGVSGSGVQSTMDKTFAEIKDAIKSGVNPVFADGIVSDDAPMEFTNGLLILYSEGYEDTDLGQLVPNTLGLMFVTNPGQPEFRLYAALHETDYPEYTEEVENGSGSN